SAHSGSTATISKISGDAQTDTAGATLAQSLVVELRDLFNNPVTGATVNWTTSGGGSASPAASITDESGRAATARILGVTAGTNRAVTTATPNGVANAAATFAASVTAGHPVQIQIVDGDLQNGLAAAELANVLRARVG